MSTETPMRRTKRRYAHELYPHAVEGETRPLAVEVPYRYARAVGLDVYGTSWGSVEPPSLAAARISKFSAAARIALLADALAQGLTGDEAWTWADQHDADGMESFYERAAQHGILTDQIKPYPCGPEPDHHFHDGDPMPPFGWRSSVLIETPESACDECTEPIDAATPTTGRTTT